MNQIVAAGGHHDHAEDAFFLRRQAITNVRDMVERIAARNGQIQWLEVWQHFRQANAFHFVEFIERIGNQTIEIRMSLGRAEARSYAVADSHEQHFPVRPRLFECRAIDLWPRGSATHRQVEIEINVGERCANQKSALD